MPKQKKPFETKRPKLVVYQGGKKSGGYDVRKRANLRVVTAGFLKFRHELENFNPLVIDNNIAQIDSLLKRDYQLNIASEIIRSMPFNKDSLNEFVSVTEKSTHEIPEYPKVAASWLLSESRLPEAVDLLIERYCEEKKTLVRYLQLIFLEKMRRNASTKTHKQRIINLFKELRKKEPNKGLQYLLDFLSKKR